MHIVDDLRVPACVEEIVYQLRLHLRQHEPVAIVVVTDVWMVEPGHATSLEGRAHRASVPIHHHLLTVGVD